MKTDDTPPTSEQPISSDKTYVSALNKWQLKWKTKAWYLLLLSNFSMVLLMALERIIANRSEDSFANGAKLALLAGGVPLVASLFLYYMYQTLKYHREHEGIVKPTRLKYFRAGTGSSFILSLLAATALICSLELDKNSASIIVFTFIGFGCLLGLCSSIFTSIYGFCVAFDVFYHKHKEEIIMECLKANQAQTKASEGPKDDPDFKIIEEAKKDED